METMTPRWPDNAPKDGRVYQGYFERSAPRGEMLVPVTWRPSRGWVDLEGHEVGADWHLSAWSPKE